MNRYRLFKAFSYSMHAKAYITRYRQIPRWALNNIASSQLQIIYLLLLFWRFLFFLFLSLLGLFLRLDFSLFLCLIILVLFIWFCSSCLRSRGRRWITVVPASQPEMKRLKTDKTLLLHSLSVLFIRLLGITGNESEILPFLYYSIDIILRIIPTK